MQSRGSTPNSDSCCIEKYNQSAAEKTTADYPPFCLDAQEPMKVFIDWTPSALQERRESCKELQEQLQAAGVQVLRIIAAKITVA